MSIRLIDKHTDLEVTDCPSCGVDFAAPARLLRQRREQGGDFYCPNGHVLKFTETEIDKLRKRTKSLDAQLTSSRDQQRATRAELESAERSRSALRGVVTRERNRVARGVCPCCSRTFADLAQHMAGQHPGYADVAPEEVPGE